MIDIGDISKLKQEMALAASLMERDFPLIYNLVTSHLLLQETDTSEKFGPAHAGLMLCFKRLNSFITHRVMNRKHLEASVICTIQTANWVNDVILGKRLECTEGYATNHLESVLMDAVGDNHTTQRQKTKKKKGYELSTPPRNQIQNVLGVDVLLNNFVTILKSYK